jgi:hypothetical protein
MPFGPTVPTLLKDRIRLWKEGVRDVVMELCCALHSNSRKGENPSNHYDFPVGFS